MADSPQRANNSPETGSLAAQNPPIRAGFIQARLAHSKETAALFLADT
jgi:hypothetical protein